MQTPVSCTMDVKTTTKKVKPKYLDSLEKIARERYLSKLKLIDNIDPYEVDKKQLSNDPKGLPPVTFFDIVNYLVYQKSAYSTEDMRAYKSLESYNQFVNGFVKDVSHLRINDNIMITAKVRHSQRMNEAPLNPWLITDENGIVQCAHCNCMAGLGESCTHVGALLFYVDAAVRIKNSKTVTQEAAYWLLPTGIKNVEYSMIKDINFQSAKTMKKKLDQEISSPTINTPKHQIKQNQAVQPPTESEMTGFLQKLSLTNKQPAILSVKRDYSEKFIPSCLSVSFPTVLSELRDDTCIEMPIEELRSHCDTVFEDIKVTNEQANNVEVKTRDQAESKQWFRFRTGRVTASRMKDVCATKIENPAQSVIKGICYPHTQKFSTKATNWGCEHEASAYDEYSENMNILHTNFKVRKSGLVINPSFPYIGASPDGVVSCECCGEGTVEIKCPYCLRDSTLTENVGSKSCLENIDGELHLKRSHPYYYQVQTQIFVCEKEYCDFVVWTQNDIHVERLEPDVEFWNRVSEKAKFFFKDVVLPELVGKYYSRSKPANTETENLKTLLPNNNINVVAESALPQASCSNASSDDEIICFCQKVYDETQDRVIGCDNQNCFYRWFHFKCINLKRAPKGNWFCPECRKSPEFKDKISKKSAKKK